MPPVLILHGEDDRVVPVSEATRLQQLLERAGRALPSPMAQFDLFRRELEDRQAALAPLLVQLHGAAEETRWRDVVELAERVLAVAPQHAEAKKLRGRAWKAIEPVTVAARSAPLPSGRITPSVATDWGASLSIKVASGIRASLPSGEVAMASPPSMRTWSGIRRKR